MKTSKYLLLAALFALLVATSSCGSNDADNPAGPGGPRVILSITLVPHNEVIDVTGTGFTPDSNVTSHLLQPDGREFPYLPILTDSNGEFTHEVETLLLISGTHELWVIDDATDVSSNIATFDVTRDQPAGN